MLYDSERITMNNIQLEDLGYNQIIKEHRSENQFKDLEIGRVALEHRERYQVLTEAGEIEAELLGNLRYSAESRADLPVVGDWVAFSPYDDRKGLIHSVYPRHSLLERSAVGKKGEKQLIAANIDIGWIVQSLNRDFNLNRLERYITICHSAGITPVILLSKIDLVTKEELHEHVRMVSDRLKDTQVIAFSNVDGAGFEKLQSTVERGKTYCLLGSSGVGKSSLINRLTGTQLMETGSISDRIDRGKHVTTHRELILLDSGAIFIDNPGMREVGIGDGFSGLEATFQEIGALANGCKFKDCTHLNEKGCAVLEALDSGHLDQEVYEHYLKLEREEAHFSATIHERRAKEKRFGKMIKEVVQQKKKYKY